MTSRKIAWFTPHPTHYNSYLFEKLKEQLHVEIDEIYFERVLQRYPWKNNFKLSDSVRYLKKKLLVDWKLLVNFMVHRERYNLVVVAGWAEPTMFLLLTLLSLSKAYKFGVYTDTPKVIRERNFKQWLRKYWINWMLRNSSFVLVTGEVGRKIMISWGAPSNSTFNFPFATDERLFSPANPVKAVGEPLTLFSSGRLDIAHKGYDTAIRALGIFKNKNPDVKFVYNIAGEGADRSRLKKIIEENGLTNEVNLLGWVEVDQLVSLYQRTDIFLHTANVDPFPNAILEAMSCGLMVIASDTSGSAVERIRARENGFIHPRGDFQKLFEIISEVAFLSDEETLKIKRNAHETALLWNVSYHCATFSKLLK